MTAYQNNSQEPKAADKSVLEMLADVSAELKAIKADNADMRARLDEAQRVRGDVEPYEGFSAHVVHIMNKHFYHDKPEAPVETKAA